MKATVRTFFKVIAAIFLASSGAVSAQMEGSYSGEQSGLDLVDVDFMFIGAHPDDESGMTATMARYVLDEGFKGTVITLTQGEGGGNATGLELGPSLGIVRAEELRRSLHMVGIDSHYFTGQTDFYYTLFAEEAQKIWGDKYVCDVTRIVRITRPEVIVTMWPGPGTHGHHQMSARTATTVFDRANDPSFCPEQLSEEFIQPWQPLKLYYYGFGDTVTVEIPTDTWSRSAYMPYADLKSLALANFRSQGFDQFFTVPVTEPEPEGFILVKSRVPVEEPETHLLAGAVTAAGNSPPGVRLLVTPASYRVGVGEETEVTVKFTNRTGKPLNNLALSMGLPEGLSVSEQGESTFATVKPGESVEASYTVEVSDQADLLGQHRVQANYTAMMAGRNVSGQNLAYLEVSAPVEVAFKPLYDIANYRSFARETDTEWVIPLLPTRLPLTVGKANTATVEITNLSTETAQGQLEFKLPEGIQVEGDRSFEVPAGETLEKTLDLTVSPSALPAGKDSTSTTGTVSVASGNYTSSNEADIYVLPTLTVQRVDTPPTIDGDLADMQPLPTFDISAADLWEGEAEGDADISGQFRMAYDDQNLYLGVRVHDQSVVCNIAPDDVRAHWRSDSVEVTIDPSGESENTSSTFKTGIFPCTTDGFVAKGERDADANQGVIEKTAPGMKIASKRLDDGYALELLIPWADMPSQPSAGNTVGFNVLLYDGDQVDARAGANIGESRTGWASVIGAQQAVPYVWPKVTLAEQE